MPSEKNTASEVEYYRRFLAVDSNAGQKEKEIRFLSLTSVVCYHALNHCGLIIKTPNYNNKPQ